MSRLLAIGDIHGQAGSLEVLLEFVSPGPGDRVILLGDYVNGGAESARVLDRVGWFVRAEGMVALRGNHDEAFETALGDSVRFGEWRVQVGPETIRSYERIGLEPRRAVIRARHAHVLRGLVDWHEEPEALFVHGGVDPALPMDMQRRHDLLWKKIVGRCSLHRSGKVVVCGHTRQRDGLPRDFGGAICIDTDSKSGGWLTCLDVVGRRCWQARPDGGTREIGLEVM